MIFLLSLIKEISHSGRYLALNISTKLYQGQKRTTVNWKYQDSQTDCDLIKFMLRTLQLQARAGRKDLLIN